MRARGIDPLKERKNAAKKSKVAPVVSMDKMQRMMKKMNLAGGKKNEDSSDWEDAVSETGMEVDQAPAMTKLIKKRKPLPRSYYQALKKSTRRQAKAGGNSGLKEDISKLDAILAELQD